MHIFKYLWELNDKVGCCHVDNFPPGLMIAGSVIFYLIVVFVVVTCIIKINIDFDSFYPKQTFIYTIQCLLSCIIPTILLIIFLGLFGVVVNTFVIVISLAYLLSENVSGSWIQKYLHEISEIENFKKYKQVLTENYNKLQELNKDII